MPIRYRVETETMTVRIRVSNPLTSGQIEDYFLESRADVCVRPDMHRLLDLRGVAPMPETADIVRIARSRRGAEPLSAETRIAVIVDSGLAYGISMMFGVHAGMHDDEFQAFWSESEAVAWIYRGSPVAAW
jgi:hypothetical protein